jgi:hypothetical protein
MCSKSRLIDSDGCEKTELPMVAVRRMSIKQRARGGASMYLLQMTMSLHHHHL